MFSNSTEIEASSNDNNSINYLKLKNKSTSLSTIYSEKYQTRIHNQINKQKKLNNSLFAFHYFKLGSHNEALYVSITVGRL